MCRLLVVLEHRQEVRMSNSAQSDRQLVTGDHLSINDEERIELARRLSRIPVRQLQEIFVLANALRILREELPEDASGNRKKKAAKRKASRRRS